MLLCEETQAQLVPAVQQPGRRSSPRTFAVCPIYIGTASSMTHGIVRDISAGGIFFYSNLRPQLHEHLEFVVHLKGKTIRGRGEVVRVEQNAPGAAFGIALKISGKKLVLK